MYSCCLVIKGIQSTNHSWKESSLMFEDYLAVAIIALKMFIIRLKCTLISWYFHAFTHKPLLTHSYLIFCTNFMFFSFREKKQKIEDIKKNIRDAILVSTNSCNINCTKHRSYGLVLTSIFTFIFSSSFKNNRFWVFKSTFHVRFSSLVTYLEGQLTALTLDTFYTNAEHK